MFLISFLRQTDKRRLREGRLQLPYELEILVWAASIDTGSQRIKQALKETFGFGKKGHTVLHNSP